MTLYSFWGVTSAQTYIYYQRYPNDPVALKSIASLRSRRLVLSLTSSWVCSFVTGGAPMV